jgi:hypothetical protein
MVFKRFVSWIRFGEKKVKKVRFVSFRKDSFTNPAFLQILQASLLFASPLEKWQKNLFAPPGKFSADARAWLINVYER